MDSTGRERPGHEFKGVITTTIKNRVTTRRRIGTRRQGTARRRITAAVAVTAGLFILPAAAATAAPSEAPDSGASASDSEAAAFWKYKDWYYFKVDCHDVGQNLVANPYLDYEDYRCEHAGTWPTDYYNLYMKS